jgi:hypothetical protein
MILTNKSINRVRDKVYYQERYHNKSMNRVRDQVYNQLRYQVDDQVRNQSYYLVYDQLDQVWYQVWDKVCSNLMK